jgi:hypothetical protein
MAETLTKAELDKARAELRRVNEQHFGRAPQDSPKEAAGTAGVVEVPTPVGNSQDVLGKTVPPDPGPPRFLGVDLDNKLAGLAGGAIIAISEVAQRGIVDLLLVELRANMDRTLETVAATHAKSAQLEIPFEEPDGDPA